MKEEDPLDETESLHIPGKQRIRAHELRTFLKVGQTLPDQKDPTPFTIEWIPDILPFMQIGELRIKFEYGHERNGHLEQRVALDCMQMNTISGKNGNVTISKSSR